MTTVSQSGIAAGGSNHLTMPALSTTGGDEATHAVERVLTAIRGRSSHLLSLPEMAEIASLSRWHFNRTFRRLTGMPPRMFQAAVRMHLATRLLLSTDMSVTDVCYEVGYTSFGTFVSRFRRSVGLSPRQLRAAARLHRRVQRDRRDWLSASSPLEPARSGAVVIDVVPPPTFDGTIFIGAFPGELPMGRPLGCKVMTGAGQWCVAGDLADARVRLFAVAFERDSDPLECLLLDNALRGTASWPNGAQRIELRLRPPRATDPPILPVLPLFIAPVQACRSIARHPLNGHSARHVRSAARPEGGR